MIFNVGPREKQLIMTNIDFTENQIRDKIFDENKDSFSDLIIGRRDPIKWDSTDFPPVKVLLQQMTEGKINSILDSISNLTLSCKELRLEKTQGSTTRVDLFGHAEGSGIVIIELKKSHQTERQSFTELLAYSNHFCTIFPGLSEPQITSILVAPMESRTIRDAYVQELLLNNKCTLALIPSVDNGNINLKVYYPENSYYDWYENNVFDDDSMGVIALSFPEVEGWIDLDKENNGVIPDHSRSALNTLSNSISHKLESENIHSIVYAAQQWGEIGILFPNPNTIYIVYINPFAHFRTSILDECVVGDAEEGRLSEVQYVFDQIEDSQKDYFFEFLESDYSDRVIMNVKRAIDGCLMSTGDEKIEYEVSLPSWGGIKTNMLNSVFTHNLEIYQTGLIASVYNSYIKFIYDKGFDELYYSDDLPKYSYKTLRDFLPVWEILRRLGLGYDDDE